MEWSNSDGTLLLSLLRSKSDLVNIGSSKVVCQVIKEVSTIIADNTTLNPSHADVLAKIKAMNEEYTAFCWFLSRPGITYVEQNNLVIAHDEYLVVVAGHENPRDRNFRMFGLPAFPVLREVFDLRALGRVDFQWLGSTLTGGDGRWIGEPTERQAW